MSTINFQEFVDAYIVCALWSSCGPKCEPYACENLDDLFGPDNISDECRLKMEDDCRDFIEANESDLIDYCEKMRNEEWSGEARAGHDFWLTRNGHGAGFWDRGLGELGDRLSDAAQVYGEVYLYPSDGRIYC